MTLPFATSVFRAAGAVVQRRMMQQFRASTIGRIGRDLEGALKRPCNGTMRTAERALKQLNGKGTKHLVKQAFSGDLGQFVRQIEKYQKLGGAWKTAAEELLGALGPAGKLLRAVAAPTARGDLSKELRFAADLLRAFGWEVIPPSERRTPADVARGVAASKAFLEELGYVVTPRERVPEKPEETLPFGVSKKTAKGAERKVLELPMSDGRKRRFPVNHPIVTGKMVSASSSTNVYEFGYDIESAYLYVRFQTPHREGERGTAGSLYRYSNVEPELFLTLYEARHGGGGVGGDSTPGTWIWTHLRERGTVSGHRKDYELVGITQGYVPRKATMTSEGEAYKQRRIKTSAGRWLTSPLPDELVTRWTRTSGKPNRGEPNRGTPRRDSRG